MGLLLQGGEDEGGLLFRDRGPGVQHADPGHGMLMALLGILFQLNGVTAEDVFFLIVFKKRADGAMDGHLPQLGLGRQGEFAVDIRPASHAADVALHPAEPFDKLLFQRRCRTSLCQFNGPPRIAQHLDRFDAGYFIKKPAAARIHQHGISLHLQQLPCQGALRRGQ